MTERDEDAKFSRRPGAVWRLLAREPEFQVENRGTFDELVVDHWLHLEQMTDRTWWLRVGDARVNISITASGAPIVDVERGVYRPVAPRRGARARRLVADLLRCLSPVRSKRTEFLAQLQCWLRVNLDSWDAGLRASWGLDELAEQALSAYPVDAAALDPEVEFARLDAVRPRSADQLAMRLRDILWAGTTLESEIACPRCDHFLRYLDDGDALVFACDLCSWSQTEAGERSHAVRLVRPSKKRLAQWRVDIGEGAPAEITRSTT